MAIIIYYTKTRARSRSSCHHVCILNLYAFKQKHQTKQKSLRKKYQTQTKHKKAQAALQLLKNVYGNTSIEIDGSI